MKKENRINDVVSKLDKKQLIVGIIILVIALLVLAYGFMSDNTKTTSENVQEVTVESSAAATETTVEESNQKAEEEEEDDGKEPHVSLTFTATTDKDVEYLISYTTDEEITFNGKNAFTYLIKKGTEKYKIDFPVEKIVNFRMDMGMDSGKMVVQNLKLVGTQEEDISSPMYYEMMGKVSVGDNNSFVIEDKSIPAIIYHPEFKNEVENKPESNAESTEETAAENIEAPIVENTEASAAENAEKTPAEETEAEPKDEESKDAE